MKNLDAILLLQAFCCRFLHHLSCHTTAELIFIVCLLHFFLFEVFAKMFRFLLNAQSELQFQIIYSRPHTEERQSSEKNKQTFFSSSSSSSFSKINKYHEVNTSLHTSTYFQIMINKLYETVDLIIIRDFTLACTIFHVRFLNCLFFFCF